MLSNREAVRAKLRRKTIWTVSEFATWCEVSAKIARRLLRRYDATYKAKYGVPLLTQVGGSRGWEFRPSALSKIDPDVFERLDNLEVRVEAQEERLDDYGKQLTVLKPAVAANTAAVARLQRVAPRVVRYAR